MEKYIRQIPTVTLPTLKEFDTVLEENRYKSFQDLPLDKVVFVFGAEIKQFDRVYLVCLDWEKFGPEVEKTIHLSKYNNTSYFKYVRATPHFTKFMEENGYLKGNEVQLPMGHLRYYGPHPTKGRTHDFQKYAFIPHSVLQDRVC